MKVKHVFGGHLYLISNFGVARNPIFRNDKDVEVFKEYMAKYLGDVCEIYAYAHEYNQFHYLIKVRERSYLEAFFYKKQAMKSKDESHSLYDKAALIPPESYLIISQEVSNCLNAYAKKFNFKYKRKGSLFGDRYSKYLVESESEMEMWIGKLNRLEELVVFSTAWQVEDAVDLENGEGECSSLVYYKKGGAGQACGAFKNFVLWIQDNMRGCFVCLPPASIKAPDFTDKFNHYKKKMGIPPPW